jgi:hypothetical protein
VDSICHHVHDFFPGVGGDDRIDATVGQNIYPVLEERNEDEDAGFVPGMMQPVLDKGNHGFFFHFGGNLVGVNEASAQ